MDVKTKVILWLVGIVAVGALVLQAWDDARRAERVQPGATAPDVTLEMLDGTKVSVSDFAGKVVLIDFWATWCPPCREEMPHFVKLAKEYESEGLVFLAPTRDERRMETAVRKYSTGTVPGLAEYVAWADDEVALAYNVDVLPTLYFVDREGRIGEAMSGFTSEEALRKRIEGALKK